MNETLKIEQVEKMGGDAAEKYRKGWT